MTDQFVPFAIKSSSTAISKYSCDDVQGAGNGCGAEQSFQPFEEQFGEGQRLDLDRERAQVQLSLVRDGDRITGIRVKCGCGETVEMDCVY